MRRLKKRKSSRAAKTQQEREFQGPQFNLPCEPIVAGGSPSSNACGPGPIDVNRKCETSCEPHHSGSLCVCVRVSNPVPKGTMHFFYRLLLNSL